MKRSILFALATVLLGACSTKEIDIQTPVQDDVIFYASFEQPTEEGTKVYANEDLLLRWTADDRVSIFNKNTYNQQYKFTGETGDNAGGFDKVTGSEFTTGNAISHIVSVYPYQESTKISESETITVTLPAKQHYAENTFGLGDNTMVSITSDTFLQYKNVGGYLRISLYGEGVSVSSITLKGNNGEKLAGKATVTMPLDGTPSAVMANDATGEITLVCQTPVALGATAEKSVDFWFVVPPITFSQGFTVSVTPNSGYVFVKTTSKSVTIERSNLSKMSPIEVEETAPESNIVFADDKVKQKLVAAFDTNGDGELSYSEAAAVTSGNDLKAAFGSIKTYKSFDEFQYFTGITSMASSMFEDWNLFTSVILPPHLKTISSSSFKGCIKIKSIIIPEDVINIEGAAFYGCSSLESIQIPDKVGGLGAYVFYDCSSLKCIDIPESVASIGQYAFYGCSSLINLVIPKNVSVVRAYSFYGCSSLSSLQLPDKITVIEQYAFYKCSNLTSFNMPANVTSIGLLAFGFCSGLTDISIPESTTKIDIAAFSMCSGIRSIIIPESISIIDEEVFLGCSSLTSIVIPESVTRIGAYALNGCSSLTELSLPESVTSIGKYAFAGCAFTSLSIPGEVSAINEWTFASCPNLTSIILPENVTSIGSSAFKFCSSLSSILIQGKLSSLGSSAFEGCSSLESIIIPEEVTSFLPQYLFKDCTLLKNVSLPKGITGIDYGVFENCSSLESINIPECVTYIGTSAFKNCTNLSSIILPESVGNIYSQAFYGCQELTSITVLPLTPPSGGANMFDNTGDCSIFVPASSVDTYKSAQFWKNYASRIQAIP